MTCDHAHVPTPTASVTIGEVDTPSGLARTHTEGPSGRKSRGLLVLGHGAGGGVDAPDLLAVAAAGLEAGWRVVRVEQPYRVRGRRAPEPAPRLDAAWVAVIESLRAGSGKVALVVGGRSSGARVACRTAEAVGASAVLALAFPLHPPGKPDRSRADELVALDVPALVVQGDRDAFGRPAELPKGPTVVTVPGDHSLRTGAQQAGAAVGAWLAGIEA
jgi:predicted alpha/beta-hydrolase family hydrolase